MDKKTKRFAIGAAIAGAVGYVAGILTAPKSGKETRKDIHDAASKAIAEAEKKLKSLHSELGVLIEQGKKNAASMQAAAKIQLNEALDAAQTAKDKAREILSAIHDGGADDKDLQRTIDEVNKAIKHLKKYLKNDGKTSSKK